MNGDHLPISGHKRKYDPAHAKKIKEGGKRAQKIHKETTEKHQKEDVPKAEEELQKDLESIT
jgi:hypothetical protein